MKGDSPLFNKAGSSSVKQVDTIEEVNDLHSLPMTGNANSVTKNYNSDGKLEQERYYDENGNAYLDIDYSDHGNPKAHPTVPHQHHIDWNNGRPRRGKGGDIT